ncbi:NAD(P)/FAD-dependent oxidoreductase [Tabrizicola sp.]|uniref:NAD(P)/FAD-dependent oxidoreductase n=1 Tax=Tabrizicola sp. TaxID=2005166 RepID=UPI002734B20E|nr:FAD-dependent oxidoreductase [Tabrizicola sp.]MDP3195676.1 FAD-dependent oxidoreductase [Tabrizicola sp.]
MTEPEVIVIGSGPAGLGAATALAQAGRRVLVLERETQAGGIPRHCGHYPFGMREFQRLLRGPDYAARLTDAARAAGVTIRTRTTVTSLQPGGVVEITDDAGPSALTAKVVLMATGVRETSRAARLIGGEKPGGVLSTGALQGMVYLNRQRPFRQPVILGSELVAFSALLTCRHAGIRPLAMIEPASRITTRTSARWLAAAMRVPILLHSDIAAIHGRTRVDGVTLATPAGQRDLPADGVIVSGGFRPDAALLVGSHLQIDAASGGPVIDRWGRLSDPAYFACGNLLRGVETAGWCWSEGRRVAQAILAALQDHLPEPGGVRLSLAHPALRLAVPQVVGAGASGSPYDRLQVRLSRPAKGQLRLMQDGRILAATRIDSRPERRLSLLLPHKLGHGPLTLTIDEKT